MRLRKAIAMAAFYALSGCSPHGNQKSILSGGNEINSPPAQLTKWSWLPPSTAHAAEVATIPPGAKLALFVPATRPIRTHSDALGGIDSDLNFIPTGKNSLVVDGGALVSQLGPITKTAEWGGWDEFWSDAAHKSRFGWGYCVTAGEVVFSRKVFEHPPSNRYARNAFDIEAFGDQYVLVRVDSAKFQHLCWLEPSYGGGAHRRLDRFRGRGERQGA